MVYRYTILLNLGLGWVRMYWEIIFFFAAITIATQVIQNDNRIRSESIRFYRYLKESDWIRYGIHRNPTLTLGFSKESWFRKSSDTDETTQSDPAYIFNRFLSDVR